MVVKFKRRKGQSPYIVSSAVLLDTCSFQMFYNVLNAFAHIMNRYILYVFYNLKGDVEQCLNRHQLDIILALLNFSHELAQTITSCVFPVTS